MASLTELLHTGFVLRRLLEACTLPLRRHRKYPIMGQQPDQTTTLIRPDGSEVLPILDAEGWPRATQQHKDFQRLLQWLSDLQQRCCTPALVHVVVVVDPPEA